MAYTDHLVDNPSLSIFLPLLYVVWADSVLTPSELEKIKFLTENQDWIGIDERKLIAQYLDPSKPPAPVEMKKWLKEIRKVSDQFSPDIKKSLVDIGIKLAELNGDTHSAETREKAKNSVDEIENALGIQSTEYGSYLMGQHQEVATEKAHTDSSFDPGKMAALLDGEHHDIITRVKTVISDPKFTYYSSNDVEGYREKVLEWCRYLAEQGFGSMAFPSKYGGGDDMGRYFTIMETLSYHDLSLVIKFGVQFGLFGMSVYFLGTEKHHEKYLKEIGNLSLPGSFAMTETGHGSNVRNIQTTATYNREEKTFTVHTPTDFDRKDYIGNAAAHGRMATVFAKLIIDGTDYGVNAFLVPLRDVKGNTLEGIRTEDCGKKLGLNGVDNGRIWFDQVVIPKDNMLDRFASVTANGEFESPISSDSRRFFTMLGTLVGGRIGIPRSGLSAAKTGLTIAIRYGDTRRQFGPEKGKEVPILNYRTHQRRLLPLLSNAYGLHFTLQYLTNRYLKRSDDDMREIEALAAGLKAFSTWNTTSTLQTSREACGGQGYLWENRVGILKNDTEIYTTFEGDNTVLMQLVAKSRLTDFKQEFHDINFFGIVNYIKQQAMVSLLEMNPVTVRNTDESHLLDPEFQLGAFRYRERHILASAGKRLKKHLDNGMDSFDAFNQCQYHLLNVGFAYIERIILEQFVEKAGNTEDPELKIILKKLCDLFALTQIEKNKGWYLEHDYMAGVKTKAIRRLVNKLCWDIRQDAVPLVDAFRIPEVCLKAPIAIKA